MGKLKKYQQRKVNNTPLVCKEDEVAYEQPLATNLPKPNVVRIEVLPSPVRQSYMGGWFSEFDMAKMALQSAMHDDPETFKPFYGILSSPGDYGFELKASWTRSNGETGFDGMMNMAADIAKFLPVVGKHASYAIGGLHNFVNDASNFIASATGTNMNATGSGTMKKLKTTELNTTIPLHFTWYMPEQENMCRLSLSRLIKMAYVRSAKIDDASIQKMVATATQYAKDMVGITKSSVADQGIDKISEYITSFAQMIGQQSVRDFLGISVTMNPMPVRVSIGHIMDLQPMVIDHVKVSCSHEQFVSSDGTHLPLFVNADVTVSYWLNPNPDSEFFGFMGDEIFANKNAK